MYPNSYDKINENPDENRSYCYKECYEIVDEIVKAEKENRDDLFELTKTKLKNWKKNIVFWDTVDGKVRSIVFWHICCCFHGLSSYFVLN